jgi:hypothetical protein
VRREPEEIEPVVELEALDLRADRPRDAHLGELLRCLVDGHDQVTGRGQRVGDPTGAAAQVEDSRSGIRLALSPRHLVNAGS